MVLQSSGPISFSQIRDELGGPSNGGAISMSQYTRSGTYGSVMQSNPNGVPSSGSNVSFSKFYSAAKYVYPSGMYAVTEQASQSPGGWSITDQNANAKLIWIGGNAYQNNESYPIVNYPVNYYYIFQNTSGSDIAGTIYIFMDDNLQLYLNDVNIFNQNYTGGTVSTGATFKVGYNIIKANVINTGGPGGFIMTFKKNSDGSSITYTNSNWYSDVNCAFDWRNWYSIMTAVNIVGPALTTQGSDPNVQYQLGFSSGNTVNELYKQIPIQNYSNFVLYFQIYVLNTSGADGLFCYIGSDTYDIIEGGGFDSFSLNFQIYTGIIPQGIYLRDGSSTTRGFYNTTEFLTNTWQDVYIYYTKGTTNTWQIYWNGTNVINYSDPNNATYVANAGNYFGFGFRDGGVAGSAWIRRVQLYHRD